VRSLPADFVILSEAKNLLFEAERPFAAAQGDRQLSKETDHILKFYRSYGFTPWRIQFFK
jgi:hypothetical protein